MKADVLFEEEIIQKIVSHLIHLCKKHSSLNALDVCLLYKLLKKTVLSVRI